MSLFKICVSRGEFSYSCLIQARNTAEALQFAQRLFKTATKRTVIQVGSSAIRRTKPKGARL